MSNLESHPASNETRRRDEIRESPLGERISARHRCWGHDCQAIKLGFLLIEPEEGKPRALVAYKHENDTPICTGHPSLRALVDLADRAALPAFVVRYADDFSRWYVSPLNDHARAIHGEPGTLSEEQWVELLDRCRR